MGIGKSTVADGDAFETTNVEPISFRTHLRHVNFIYPLLELLQGNGYSHDHTYRFEYLTVPRNIGKKDV